MVKEMGAKTDRTSKWGLLFVLSIAFLAPVFSGCAAFTVLGRPKAKNLDALKVGVPRGLVLSELNPPIETSAITGDKCDLFSFDKGVSGGWKFGRAVFHLGADLFTIFLWEIVGWPAEKIASGPNTKMQICYDEVENVKMVKYFE